MPRVRWFAAAIVTTASVGSVAANDAPPMSWNYLDVQAVRNDITKGGRLDGSLSFARKWLFQGTYLRLEPKGTSGTTQEIAAGLGYRFGLGSHADIVLGGGYSQIKTDFEALSWRAHGGYLTAQVRGRLHRRVQLDGYVTGTISEDTDLVDNDVEYGVRGRFYFTPLLSISLGVSDSDQSEEPVYTAGIRLEGTGFGI